MTKSESRTKKNKKTASEAAAAASATNGSKNVVVKKKEPHRQNLKRNRPAVQVVVAANGFPLSWKTKRDPNYSRNRTNAARGKSADQTAETAVSTDKEEQTPVAATSARLLDWNETAQEIRALAATAFVKKQKRSYQDEQYKMLTGRERKKPSCPLPLVRAARKKAAAKQARESKEAQEAGIVLPTSMSRKKKEEEKERYRRERDPSRIHGPAPSIGFMKKGVLHMKEKPSFKK
jgi:Domain of unknown function (DUF4602)